MSLRLCLISVSVFLVSGCVAVDVDESYTDTRIAHDSGPDGTGLGLPFSKAVSVGDIIFLSGELGILPGERTPVPGGAGPETIQIFKNIETTLKRNGADLSDIVKCSIFLENMEDYGAVNEAYSGALPDPKPARSTFGVDGIALGASLEIECIAVR